MEKTTKNKNEYIRTIGRRKTSTAVVKMVPSTKNSIHINGKVLNEYFVTSSLMKIVNDPILKSKIEKEFTITVTVQGGGIHSQSEAVRHGISRALTIFDEELRGNLKKAGFLKRDPRMKERRKFGLKKARKSPQWSKR